MKTRSKKNIAKIVAFLLIVPMVAAIAMTAAFGSQRVFAANGGSAVPGFNSMDEAVAAATDLNVEMTGEGSVLLKNKDKALPLNKANVGVTVFGAASQALQGGTGKVNEALKEGGFKVNGTVVTEKGGEGLTAANDATETTVKDYKDVAVVVLKRGGGEGSDLAVATSEKADDENENSGWTHKRLAQNAEGKDVKHNQMITKDELYMIEKAKALCGKVVVLLNTSNAMEMYNLQRDNDIDAIMMIGRPGANGVKAIPKLLSGEVNPSGKLADEWVKDFTADPTWYNSIANVQNDAGSNTYILPDGSQASSIQMHGVDYSEDIYLGYKYYETVYAEILSGNLNYDSTAKKLTKADAAGGKDQADAWFNDNVVYPFGYGESYTKFKMTVKGISASELEASLISSSAESPAKVKSVTVTVEVENTGDAAGKQVVQIYSQAPYTRDGIEKATVGLVAYGKTKTLAKNEKQTLKLNVNLQDMASYDYADANDNGFKGYELEEGAYTLYAADSSHCTADTAKTTLTIRGNAKMAADDFSDNEIENLFSKENGRNYSLRKNDADWNADGEVNADDKMFSKEQALLSRADMVGTFPEAPVTRIDDKPVSEIKEFGKTQSYAIGDVVKVTEVTQGVTGTSSVSYYKFKVAHSAGDFNKDECDNLSGNYEGGLVVTDAFADLMDYYAQYNLNRWATEYAYFNPASAYNTGDTFGIDDTKDVYKATKDMARVPAISTDGTFAVDSYLLDGSDIYKVTKALAKITFKDNGQKTDGIASQDYKAGDFVTYKSTSWGGERVNNVKVSKDIKAGEAFNTRSNCTSFSASMRLVKTGDDANVAAVTYVDYVKDVMKAELQTDKNSGKYSYTDELFDGVAGKNGYNSKDDLYNVTADMMKGWSQMASVEAQTAAMGSGDWIYFNELSGIEFNDTSMIKSGRFAGRTGVDVWVQFMNQWTWNDFFTACWNGGSDGSPVPNLGIPVGGTADSPTSWNGTYTWCCNTTIAQTWNVELGEEQGIVTADMGLFKNLAQGRDKQRDQWLNPAINTHRTPFSGRNNEYYSQDGYHAGWMAQAVVRGIQSQGVGSHLKHMFLNDQETNRNSGDLMAWVSEQAIREIYIKPFQMGIQEGGADGAMSAFARIGSVPTPVSENMCNWLVRKEWGSTNFMFHPDMYSPQANVASEDLMLRTGHNHAPGGNNTTNMGTAANNTYSGRWDAEYDNKLTGTKGGVYLGRDNEKTGQEKRYSNNQWYIVRYSAMIMYSEYANQAHSQNGLLAYEWQGGALTVNAKDAVRLDVGYEGAKGVATAVKYEIAKGELPEGLTLDASTGMITGSTTKVGTFEITVNGTFDKWIGGSATYTITVGHGSIVSSAVNDKGELVVTYSDGVSENLGVVVGKDGAPGKDGENGKDAEGGCGGSIGGTLAIVAVCSLFGLAAIAFVARSKSKSDKSEK